jgi:hypothetical protein
MKRRERLPDSFLGPFSGVEEVWENKFSEDHGITAGIVIAAFAENEVYTYLDGAKSTGTDECFENKLKLHNLCASRVSSAEGSDSKFVGILRNSKKSLEEMKTKIAKEFRR